MGQDEILRFLQAQEGIAYPINIIQDWLGMGRSIYPEIKKLVRAREVNSMVEIGRDKRFSRTLYWVGEFRGRWNEWIEFDKKGKNRQDKESN